MILAGEQLLIRAAGSVSRESYRRLVGFIRVGFLARTGHHVRRLRFVWYSQIRFNDGD